MTFGLSLESQLFLIKTNNYDIRAALEFKFWLRAMMKKPNEAPPTVVRQRDDDNPLGSGYHLNVTGKRLLLRIHYLFVIGLLCFNSKASVAKKKFRNVHHKVAIAFGCSEKTIQRVVSENGSKDGLLEPEERGGQPWEHIDIAPLEQVAAVRKARAHLAASLQPTSCPKIKRWIEDNEDLRTESGEKITLSTTRKNRILSICGYKFGSAGHVAKESRANKRYRQKYLQKIMAVPAKDNV